MANQFPFASGWTHWMPFRSGKHVPRSGDILDTWRVRNGTTVTLRTTHEDDSELIQELVRGLSLRSRYHRFFYAMHELPAEILFRFTHNDPRSTLSMIVVLRRSGREEAIAMAQYATGIHPECAEFAIVVADEWQRAGLGKRLLETLACVARSAGVERLEGDILTENEPMQRMALKSGFELEMHPEDPHLYRAVKMLRARPDRECMVSNAMNKTAITSLHV
jgi:acetyltransferase